MHEEMEMTQARVMAAINKIEKRQKKEWNLINLKMGKRRHQSDKLWISNSEHMAEWGGKRTSSKLRSGDLAAMERLPFDHCALSMRPFVTPVASPDGYVFDFV